MTTPLFKDQFVTVIEEAKVMMSVLAVRRTAPDASANDAAEYSILQETTAMLDDLEAAANEHLETLRRQLRDSGNRIDRHAMYDDTLLGDLQRGLSAVELAQALGLSEEDVFQLESDGQLFSINCSSTRGEHEYPAFQAWEGIVGSPLKTVLSTLAQCGATGSNHAFSFFIGVTDLLGYLTPVEALYARLSTIRKLDPAVHAFLMQPAENRLESVVGTARAYAASVSGW